MSDVSLVKIETRDPAGGLIVVTVLVNSDTDQINYLVEDREGKGHPKTWAFRTGTSLPLTYSSSKKEVIVKSILSSIRFHNTARIV